MEIIQTVFDVAENAYDLISGTTFIPEPLRVWLVLEAIGILLLMFEFRLREIVLTSGKKAVLEAEKLLKEHQCEGKEKEVWEIENLIRRERVGRELHMQTLYEADRLQEGWRTRLFPASAGFWMVLILIAWILTAIYISTYLEVNKHKNEYCTGNAECLDLNNRLIRLAFILSVMFIMFDLIVTRISRIMVLRKAHHTLHADYHCHGIDHDSSIQFELQFWKTRKKNLSGWSKFLNVSFALMLILIIVVGYFISPEEVESCNLALALTLFMVFSLIEVPVVGAIYFDHWWKEWYSKPASRKVSMP